MRMLRSVWGGLVRQRWTVGVRVFAVGVVLAVLVATQMVVVADLWFDLWWGWWPWGRRVAEVLGRLAMLWRVVVVGRWWWRRCRARWG